MTIYLTLLTVWVAILSAATGMMLWHFFKTYMALTTIINIGADLNAVLADAPEGVKTLLKKIDKITKPAKGLH